MMTKKELKRLIVEVPKELHEEIKKRSLFRSLTMKRYVLQAVIEKMKEEDQFK